MRANEISAHIRVDLQEWEYRRDHGELPQFVKHVRESLAVDLARQMLKRGAIEFADSKVIVDAVMPTVQLSAYVIVGGTKTVIVERPLGVELRERLYRWWARLFVKVFG